MTYCEIFMKNTLVFSQDSPENEFQVYSKRKTFGRDRRMSDLHKPHILIAEDDGDDQLLLRLAFEEIFTAPDLHFVANGQELMDYLLGEGQYHNTAPPSRPALILLDLNMPKRGGYEVLQAIKSDPQLRQIPIVILTTSSHKGDIYKSYDLGANSFITKPHTFEGLVKTAKTLHAYWLETSQLPHMV